MLSSDILEKQFGETELVIIKQNDDYRIIKTVSKNDNQILEISLVKFDSTNADKFSDVHEQVLAGASMGKVFRSADIAFVRQPQSVTRQTLPDSLQSKFNNKGMATVIKVDILVGDDKVPYAHIIEIYSPTVEWPEKPTNNPDEDAVNELSRLLST